MNKLEFEKLIDHCIDILVEQGRVERCIHNGESGIRLTDKERARNQSPGTAGGSTNPSN